MANYKNKGNKMKPRRKRIYKRKPAIQNSKVYKIAKKANYDMIPRKLRAYDGTAVLNDYTQPQGLLIQPTLIPANAYVGAHDPDELSQRNTNQVYIERCSGVFNIRPFATLVNPLHIRKICGWWKGVSTATSDGPAAGSALTATAIQSTFSDRLARYDSTNYKIIEDKFFTIMPRNVIDNNGSDDTIGPEPMRGLWAPKLVKCNFKLNRKFTYGDGKQHGSADEIETNGANVMGWKPFIFLQVQSPDQQYSATELVNIDYKFTTYFKDVQ